MSWSKGKWVIPKESSFDEVPLQLNTTGNFSPNTAPIQFFELFCDDDFFQLAVKQSNLCNIQRSTIGYEVAVMSNKKRRRSYKKVAAVTISEMKHFFGIILYMGIQKLPNRRMYWGNFTSVPLISTTMTRNRFNEILSILHFNDNTTAFPVTSPNHNKLHKIQTIIDHFRSKFKKTVAPETFQAIDEMMVPFKGKHGANMYMPKKPIKWGYKLWCRAGISGYVYDFEVVGGMARKVHLLTSRAFIHLAKVKMWFFV